MWHYHVKAMQGKIHCMASPLRLSDCGTSMKHNGRHIYLNLLQIRLPIAGVMSIAHRVSGVLMVLAIPLLIGLLDFSLADVESFDHLAALLNGWLGWLILFVVLWALLHHLLAGIRYFLLDIDIGVDRPHYRYSAWAVMLAAPLLAAAVTGLILGGGP